jgi:hypothetical protein
MAAGVSGPKQVLSSSDEHAAGPSLASAVGMTRRGTRRWRTASPHSRKFLLAITALVAMAVAALAVALVLLANGGTPGPAAAWSPWKPPDSGVAGEREIANELSPFYRASPASQLVVVTVQNVSGSNSGSSTGSSGGTELALRDPTTGTLSAVSGNSAVYNLCGLGPNCVVSGGPASAARLLLLRREALELSLYTFKYIGGVSTVVAILPPGHTTTSCTGLCATPHVPTTTKLVNLAVVFQRQGVQHFLDRPLRLTLPEELPPTVTQMPNAPEAELVSVVTSQALFQQQLIQAQDGTNVLVLNQVPPQ